MKSLQGLNKRVLLCILDGFGISENINGNAIKAAMKPNIDHLFSHYPMTTIEAGGLIVGLPKGVSGNSEVGHMNLGAGRSVRQDLVRINECIESGKLAEMEELQKLIAYAKSHSNRIHLMGLLSNGGVHSHINHLKELVKVLRSHNIEIILQAFMDGRDTARDVGIGFVEEILKEPGFKFGSMQGRSIGMDRDRRWNKIKAAYDCLTGAGKITDMSPVDYIKGEYAHERYDEFIDPVLFDKEYAVKPDDAIFFFNFRPDRAIQITLAFADPKFNEFVTPVRPGYFLCMTPYVDDWVKLPILFDKEKLQGTMGEYISSLGLKQFRIAETEKYAHVTYFFNGGQKTPFKGEEQVLIPSPREIATYDQKPEMSAFTVCDRLIEALKDHTISLYVVNFANSDMVGHTGNFDAAVKAIEALDICVGRLMQTCVAEDVTLIVTADHGNSDQMKYDNGDIHTSHSDAPVPFCVFDKKLKNEKLEVHQGDLGLRDVAPTILAIMGIPMAPNFQGVSVFK